MLPKSKRLSTEAFKEIIEKGRSIHCPFLILRLYPTLSDSRFAISVPKKVTKTAVARNKTKKQIYSIIKSLENKIKPGFSVVIIVKPELNKLAFKDLCVEVEKSFVKASLLK